MAPLLALGAALLFGAGDFLGGVASRRARVVLVLAASQLVGLVGVATWLVASGDAVPPRADLLAAAGAGVAGCVGLAALYAGLSLGAMSIVAPVSALSPLVPFVSDAVQGQAPRGIELVGVVAALTGVVVLSREPGPRQTRFATGLGLAVVAALSFGVFALGLDAAADSSVPWATTTARATAAALALGAVLVLRESPRTLVPVAPLVIAVGVFDTSANVLLAFATTHGLISIVATLSALYPVVTVGLAIALLDERPTRARLAGGALALAGAAVVATF